ncbi:transporter substrate-binding domain-containing protein [Paracraurococcus ruber]|uniref:Solute-binding protein family 3/N-terminal domain-containing protein n=1 Tax=Paracraurococcus ruber TaxID=77675 RepID=A0ABS1CTC2_9PROT|nr:transporter substrate-binding domain-containing protein [Paracraurococcus ruber]MBK1657728.1 hypothetical protein [Paracraurococcus ruber]TDG31535.1 transporter substrate-binding domain-containing protein [Paracraurococcus ruber]
MRALLLGLLLLLPLRPAAAAPAAAALAERMLAEAQAEAGSRDCETPADALARILCQGRIRVGVRGNYPGFGLAQPAALGEARSGYEVDLARAIAGKLGVGLTLVGVTPGNRIALLLEDRVDLLIATMGHTRLRDGEVRFVRPHYYRSQTVVVGDRRLKLPDWDAVRGRTVCVTLGAADTPTLSKHGARLLIFDSPQQMLDALRLDICTLAMHDDTFFATSFADRAFNARFEVKLGISDLPWGMATAQDDRLAALLDQVSIAWHAEGRFLDAARRNHIGTEFLEEARLVWRDPACLDPAGAARPDCLAAPVDTAIRPTRFAPRVEAVEDWIEARTGIDLNLPMLKSEAAYGMFLRGIGYSLVLVGGALAATLGFSLLFGAALCARGGALRLPVRAATTLLQCSPLVLLLFFAYAVASTLLPYTAGVALVLAILMVGIYNASYASHAIAEAHAALAARRPGGRVPFRRAVRAASVQLMSFLVNATKGSAIASMIGVPELLNALTDVTSFTSERVMTYSVLLGFYALLVMLVVWLTRLAQRRLDRAPPTAAEGGALA